MSLLTELLDPPRVSIKREKKSCYNGDGYQWCYIIIVQHIYHFNVQTAPPPSPLQTWIKESDENSSPHKHALPCMQLHTMDVWSQQNNISCIVRTNETLPKYSCLGLKVHPSSAPGSRLTRTSHTPHTSTPTPLSLSSWDEIRYTKWKHRILWVGVSQIR